MSQLVRVTCIVLAAALSAVGFEEARQSITADGIRAHLFFLSGDNLQGRAPGSRGGELAGDFIASQFLRFGLVPVADSFFQTVPLTGITTDPTTLRLAFESGDRRLEADLPGEAVIAPGLPEPSIRVSGELVFAGFGAQAGRWRWDDYKGRDLNGKVVVFLAGEPPAPPDEPGLFAGRDLTYYGEWAYKMEEARRRGATGALVIHSPAAGLDWSGLQSEWTGERLALSRDELPGQPLLLQGWMTQDLARRMFAVGGLDLDELYVRATRRDFRPVSTGITVRSRMNSRSRQLETRNVVGLLRGSDRRRAGEVVVLMAHYDHLGSGPAVAGDSVYNGAYDNASGVSVLLEVADAFSRLDPRPERSVLFIATAAEEEGMLGSQYYVDHPLVPLDRTVAALNIHEVNLWGETDDVTVLGADRSTLGELVRQRADELGLAVVPDPVPEEAAFFRSDQLPFARAGVPALYVKHGVRFRNRPAGWGMERMAEFRERHHHRPSDEYHPGLDLSGAVQQGRLIFSLAYDIAMWDRVAEWNEGEVFRTAAGRAR